LVNERNIDVEPLVWRPYSAIETRDITKRGLQTLSSGLEFSSYGSHVFVEAVEVSGQGGNPPGGAIYPAAQQITNEMDCVLPTPTASGTTTYVNFSWEINASNGALNAENAVVIVGATNLAAILADTIDTMVVEGVAGVRFQIYGTLNGGTSFLCSVTVHHVWG
jgi:hypothetical protein